MEIDKTEVLWKEVGYLGHTRSATQDGLKPYSDKIRTLEDFSLSATTNKLKRILGLLGYHNQNDFAKLTKP